MQLRKAERKQAKIKMALQGSSGSGKTYSALVLAYGMTKDWSKIAIIDTENCSADLYAHLGDYKVLQLQPPFSPERYIQAIETCEGEGVEVIIIDSISHCWDFLLQYHGSLLGNSFNNWNKVTPRQNAFVEKLLQSPAHIIATMRTKQDYVLNQKDGKYVPEKVGLKAVQRDGVDYEFTIVFDLDMNHWAKASKDRTSIFMDKPEFVITEETGQKILDWCNTGTTIVEVKKMIEKSKTVEALNDLYRRYPDYYANLENDFKRKKERLIELNLQTIKTKQNGIGNNQL